MVRSKSDQITPTKGKNTTSHTSKKQTDLYAALGIEKTSNYKPRTFDYRNIKYSLFFILLRIMGFLFLLDHNLHGVGRTLIFLKN